MMRMSRLTDYGIMLLTYFAGGGEAAATHNARDVAARAHLPLPTVSKVLKVLARHGLLVAHRGVKGGFSLARRPEDISVADIIHALEGPIAITECSASAPGRCQLEQLCPVGGNWQKINQAVRGSLENITLSELQRPVSAAHYAAVLAARRRVPVGGAAGGGAQPPRGL